MDDNQTPRRTDRTITKRGGARGLVGLLATLAIIAASTGPAHAQDLPSAPSGLPNQVPFVGVVTDTCVFTGVLPGTLGHDRATKTLSSTNTGAAPGGSSGTIVATTTGPGFEISVEAPTDWSTEPPIGDSTATFSATYTVDGTTYAEGVSTELPVGPNTVPVDMTATSTNGFPAGPYAALVTMTCEAGAGS